jgi:hypothetical protein
MYHQGSNTVLLALKIYSFIGYFDDVPQFLPTVHGDGDLTVDGFDLGLSKQSIGPLLGQGDGIDIEVMDLVEAVIDGLEIIPVEAVNHDVRGLRPPNLNTIGVQNILPVSALEDGMIGAIGVVGSIRGLRVLEVGGGFSEEEDVRDHTEEPL